MYLVKEKIESNIERLTAPTETDLLQRKAIGTKEQFHRKQRRWTKPPEQRMLILP